MGDFQSLFFLRGGSVRGILSLHTCSSFVWKASHPCLGKLRRIILLTGVNFGTDGPQVTHLLFADDSIVFLEAAIESFHTLKEVMLAYESASRQKVNLQKSSIYFGDGCGTDLKDELKLSLGVEAEALCERYLGLPTVFGRSREGCFKHINERSA